MGGGLKIAVGDKGGAGRKSVVSWAESPVESVRFVEHNDEGAFDDPGKL